MSSRNDSSNSLGAGDDDISQDESQTKAAEARRLRRALISFLLSLAILFD